MIKSEIIKRLKLKGYKAELEVITKNNTAFIAVRMMLNERLGVYIYIDDLLDGNYSIDYIVDKVIEKYNNTLKADDLDIDCFQIGIIFLITYIKVFSRLERKKL